MVELKVIDSVDSTDDKLGVLRVELMAGVLVVVMAAL